MYDLNNIDDLIKIENKVLEWHNANIKDRQSRIDKLWTGWVSIWNGKPEDLTYGCYTCLWGETRQIRHADRCHYNCPFCYYYEQEINPIPEDFYMMDQLYLKDEIMLLMQRRGYKVDSFAWLQKEPLLFLNKMIVLMREIAKYGTHQYLYTNGVLADEDNLKRLRDNGLNEIRFNLQASNFSKRVLNHMLLAVKYIDNVCIETPMFSDSFNNFVKHKDLIKDSGINQINTPELQLKPENFEIFEKEGYFYRHRRGYISPITSRHYSIDLIKIANNENWPIVINDCSNETKIYRGAKASAACQFEGIAYAWDPMRTLPKHHYEWHLENTIYED
jgi:pyruvate formate-lyase activating enzyme-like uncharacterized protein